MIANAPEQIEITAQTSDQIPMALKIRNKEIYGVQFHPEAILTENGLDIFRNFIELCQHS
jgi:anthranilate/para-aminobenzoate synthase component II